MEATETLEQSANDRHRAEAIIDAINGLEYELSTVRANANRAGLTGHHSEQGHPLEDEWHGITAEIADLEYELEQLGYTR